MSSANPSIVWLRRDLRLSDQAAFAAAASGGEPVIPVYVLDDETSGERKLGGASRWWLHHSLKSLASSLEEKGSRLIFRKGAAAKVLASLAEETGASAVHALRHYEPWWREAEDALADALPEGCALCLHDGNYLLPPGTVTTGSGDPYKIYTPFWRSAKEKMPPAEPTPRPQKIAAPGSWPDSDDLADWSLLPTDPDWAGGFREEWEPGEDGADKRLRAFARVAASYESQRNLPSDDETSRLSPHLHWGEISPAKVWHAVSDAGGSVGTFLGELGWRDYAQNVILQMPDYGEKNARDRFDKLQWRNPNRGHLIAEDLKAWQKGRTGYPIVDAGMRQLWATGWMHNRVRMIAASFLIKHLLIDWREGEAWFWDTLVDADYGANSTNWQWVAGTGVDSNMFSRIMAPLSQSEKFDAAEYIREWVPELADLSDEDIHDPPEDKRPSDYPEKLIGHKEARERALDAYSEVKGT